MFKKIVNSLKDGTFKYKVINRLSVIKYIFYNKKFKNLDVDSKKIIFITFQGKYTCNPKAICNEFLKRNEDYKYLWVINKKEEKNDFPKKVKVVERGSKEFFKELSTSKYIIENANDINYLHYKKKKNQILIQTWHGSLGFKKIDSESVKNKNWIKKCIKSSSETDYIISNSKFENMVYRTSYWPNTKILEYGHARNDILFNKQEVKDINLKVRKFYNIKSGTKIVLYAPTFRDDFSLKKYDIDYDKLIQALEKRFSGNWVVMQRFHHKLRNVNFKQVSNNVIDVTNYYDIQELICCADIAITDYSSWICDFVLTGKPGFLYLNDYESYLDERGFYYPLSDSPFPLCYNNEELYQKIIKFDEKKYDLKRDKFLKDRECFEDGHASKRIVDFITKTNK